jgi:glycerol kinase
VSGDCLLAIDQGTTSSRALIFDADLAVIALAQQEFEQLYPQQGWVEHDPQALWGTTLKVAREAIAGAQAKGARVVAIGIANQRETTLLWHRDTGQPLYNAIVWQDRRTAPTCRRLIEQGAEPDLTHRTGLLLDPYFSATKLGWILDHVDGARKLAADGRLAFGTVDTYLMWMLSGGKVHATDATNASRTNLFNIRDMDWDDTLLDLFDVPRSVLPDVYDCAAEFGTTDPTLLGQALPILGVAGDQQAAAIGHGCQRAGDAKITYGTGGFLLINTGDSPCESRHRLLATVASRLDGRTRYALEGSLFIAGAAVQWLRDELGIIDHAAQTGTLAASIPDNGGVYLVPAFTGLGAPHWDADARGLLCGLERGSGRAHLARAALEATCYQTHDLLEALRDDGQHPTALRVDGGMSENGWFMQTLADVLDLPLSVPATRETTALGVAWLAGRQAGLFGDLPQVTARLPAGQSFAPAIAPQHRATMLAGWRRALQRARSAPGADA